MPITRPASTTQLIDFCYIVLRVATFGEAMATGRTNEEDAISEQRSEAPPQTAKDNETAVVALLHCFAVSLPPLRGARHLLRANAIVEKLPPS